MKRALFTTFLVLLIAFATMAQGWTTNGSRYATDAALRITFEGVLDTAGGTYDSLASNKFSLEDYDQSGTYFAVDYTFTSTTGAPNILVDWYGSTDGGTTWVLVEQVIDTTTSETATMTATNLSNKRAADYMLVFEQVASGRDDSSFKLVLESPQMDAVKP